MLLPFRNYIHVYYVVSAKMLGWYSGNTSLIELQLSVRWSVIALKGGRKGNEGEKKKHTYMCTIIKVYNKLVGRDCLSINHYGNMNTPIYIYLCMIFSHEYFSVIAHCFTGVLLRLIQHVYTI